MISDRIIIRTAVSSDAKPVQNLLAQLGYPDLSEKEVEEKIKAHEGANYKLLVAELANQVVGFISLHLFDLMYWRGKMGRITAFCVDENARSQGIGLQLLEEAERYLFSHGCEKLEVTSNAVRVRTHAFYLKAGYLEDSRRFVKYKKS